MKSTRRGFIKAACAGAGALALAPVAAHASEAKTFGENELGMLYDSTLCVGCKACVYACKKANFDDAGVNVVLADKDKVDTPWFDVYDLDYRAKNIIKMFREQINADNKDEEPKYEVAFIKRQCMHCNHPGCVSVCPVSAMIKNPDTGIVEWHANRCLGCRYCQLACPFNVPKFEWHRAIPKIVKCELCRGEYLDKNKESACCHVCPTKAVIFGKRNELLQIAKQRLADNPGKYLDKIYGEFDYGGTNVIYLSRVDFEKLGMPTLPNHSFAATSEKVQHTIYKGFIAPVALYAGLAVIALRNKSKRESEEKRHNKDKGGDK